MGSSSPHRHRCLFNRGKLQAMVDGKVIVMLLHAVAILGSKSRFHAVSQLGQPRSHAEEATPGRSPARRPAGQGPETPHRADAILTGTSCSDSFMVASCPPLLIASSRHVRRRHPSMLFERSGALVKRSEISRPVSRPAVRCEDDVHDVRCMDDPLMRRHGEL